MELCSMLCASLRFGGEWIHVYVWLNLFIVNLKLSQYCQLAIPQYKMFLVLKKKLKWKNKTFTLKKTQHKQDWKDIETVGRLCSSMIRHAIQGYAQNSLCRASADVNQELPDVQAGFKKGRGTRAQTANICWIIEKAREFQKNIYFYSIDYVKAFDIFLSQFGTSPLSNVWFRLLLLDLHTGFRGGR